MSNLSMPRNDNRTPWAFLGDLHDKKWTAYATMVAEQYAAHEPEPIYVLLHHGSNIVEARQDGRVSICHHGHASKTTMDRINRALPVGYRVGVKNGTPYALIHGEQVPFVSRMFLENVRGPRNVSVTELLTEPGHPRRVGQGWLPAPDDGSHDERTRTMFTQRTNMTNATSPEPVAFLARQEAAKRAKREVNDPACRCSGCGYCLAEQGRCCCH